jgi:histone deacetylase 11
MNIYYHNQYNIDLGVLNRLHPFDGRKFYKIHREISGLPKINLKRPEFQVSKDIIDLFVNELLHRLLSSKRYILKALEVPYIPLIPFSVIDKRVLLPMRWAVQGTLEASRDALAGVNCWNLSGGYHHASPGAAEGFCVYNDIGIAYKALRKTGEIKSSDRILIIDVDAHHGNGNAHTFMENDHIAILDVYNDDIYPQSKFTKKRVNIPVPLHTGTLGDEYIRALYGALEQLNGNFRLSFVVAGSDVLATDKLGGFSLSVEDITKRDALICDRLKALSIPFVFLGGGGYSKQSAEATIKSISNLYEI